MMRRGTAIVLVVASLTAVTLADEPFRDISYPAALKVAKQEKKVVIIDFYTTWCGPCKMLDKITWTDGDVQKWPGEHAVCMKVDAEASREFARKFKVRAYPTIVFVKADGTVLDSIVGFQNPRAFLDSAEGAVSGKDAYTRAREAFESGDTNDPVRREHYADRLAQLGKHEEALEHYLWCFDHGEEHEPAYSGVRVSFLLGDIKQLASVYPPAMAALKKRRDRCESTLRDFIDGKKSPGQKKQSDLVRLFNRVTGKSPAADHDVSGDLAALNETLGEKDRTLKIYEKLIKCDRTGVKWIRRSMFRYIDESLLAAHRYEDYLQDSNPVPDTAKDIQSFTLTALHSGNLDEDSAKELRDYMKMHTREIVSKRYEACVGCDRDECAAKVKDMLVDFDASYLTYDLLISSAVRANRHDLIQTLSDEAQKKLDAKGAGRIAKSVADSLATPEAKAAIEKRRASAGKSEVSSPPAAETP